MIDKVFMASSACVGTADIRVECAATPHGVVIRNSVDPDGTNLTLQRIDWGRFHAAAVGGLFDFDKLQFINTVAEGSLLRVRTTTNGKVELRLDSLNPSVLTFTEQQWHVFIEACKRGELTVAALDAHTSAAVAA